MRPTRLSLGVLALSALLPASVSAQFPTNPPQSLPYGEGPVETFQFIAPMNSNAIVPGFGTQVGPYTARLVSYPGMPSVTIYCVDYLHDIDIGQVWTANVSKLVLSDVNDTRLGIAGDDLDALNRYKKAAWLASQFMVNQDQASWQQIHSAIWTTALDGNDPNKPYYGKYGNWIAQANAAEAGGYAGFDFSEWAVLTDVHAADLGYDIDPLREPGVQEYLVHVTVTPEPETVILMLSGLAVLAFAWRRRILFA